MTRVSSADLLIKLHEVWSWIQTNSTGISVVLSLFGFAITWIQLARTKRAADAARFAAREAVESVARVDTISEVAGAHAGLKELQVALRGSRYETALLRTQTLRESLFRLRARPGFEKEERQLRIQKIVTDLRKLQGTLEELVHEPTRAFFPPAANKLLSDAAIELTVWADELRYLNEEKP